MPEALHQSKSILWFFEWKHVKKRFTLIKQSFALRKFQKMTFCYFQENRSQSNDFYNWIQTFALNVKCMSTKTNVKIFNLISSLVRVLYRMEKRSVRTFDKYRIPSKFWNLMKCLYGLVATQNVVTLQNVVITTFCLATALTSIGKM